MWKRGPEGREKGKNGDYHRKKRPTRMRDRWYIKVQGLSFSISEALICSFCDRSSWERGFGYFSVEEDPYLFPCCNLHGLWSQTGWWGEEVLGLVWLTITFLTHKGPLEKCVPSLGHFYTLMNRAVLHKGLFPG